MSIFEETRAAMGGFDPAVVPAQTQFEEWGDLVPPPSIQELTEQLAAQGGLDITREWSMASAEWTLKFIAARDDTQAIPKIKED